jgi:hypothetical protein
VLRECDTNGTTPRSPMRLAEVHLTLGLIHAQRGDANAAVQSGSHALTYERKTGPQLLIRAAELNNAIGIRFPDSPRVADFDERLRSLAAEFGFQLPQNA